MSTQHPFEGPHSPMQDPQTPSQPYTAQQNQAGAGAYGGFTPNAGSYPPPRPADSGFFNSIRASGYFRSEPRVLGGVCAGLAARFGWDRTLVRVLTVVLTLFIPLLLAFYGLAWAFLPEHRDGRIHFQSLLAGHFDIAQLGALLMVLLGVGNIGPWVTVFGRGAFGIMVAVSAVVIAMIIIGSAASKASHPYGRAFPPAGTMPPSGTPPYSSTGPYAASSVPPSFNGAAAASSPAPSADAPSVVPGQPTAASPQQPSPPPTRTEAPLSHATETPMNTPDPGPSSASAPHGDWRSQGGPPPANPTQTTPHQQPGSAMPFAGPATPGTQTPYAAPTTPPPSGPQAFMAPGPTPPHTAPAGGAAPFAPPQPHPSGPGYYGAGQAPPPVGTVPPSPYSPPPAYASPQGQWTPVTPLKPRVLPPWVNLAVTGLVILLIAATLFIINRLSYDDYLFSEIAQVLLIGGGACLALVGGVIAVASLRDRGAGWMIALSIIGTFMAVPTLIVGIAGLNSPLDATVYSGEPRTSYYHWSEGSFQEITGGELDLSDMPASEIREIEIQDVVGDLTILVRKEQALQITIDDMLGSLSAEYVDSGNDWVPTRVGLTGTSTFRSISDNTLPVPTVRIHNMLGSVHVVELDIEEDSFTEGVTVNGPDSPPAQVPPASESAQSADTPQSANTPQSATTPATGQ